MKKSQLTLDERREKILEVAATGYHSSDDAAQDYLGAMEGANVEEQKLLFRVVVGSHGIRKQRAHKCPGKNSLKATQYREIADRVGDMARGWAKAAERTNAGLEATADGTWDELTLLEGNDRVVALAILLQQNVIPYAPLPGNLTVIKPVDVYADARDRILVKVAQLHRVAKLGGVTALEISAAFAKLFAEIETLEERTSFVEYFLDMVIKEVQKSAPGGLGGLLSGLLGELVLELRPPGHEHDEDDNEEN